MLSSAEEQCETATALQKTHASDEFLSAMVDACVSNVAVLDESGTILYSSKAWSSFEHVHLLPNCCRRLSESDFDENADVTLAEDIEQIVFGKETEFHRQYHCDSLAPHSAFVMHAARLNLPGSTFRVLLTHEQLAPVREDFSDSQKRLIELLSTTRILSWESKVEGLCFDYVSQQALEMLGYPIDLWYEPNFLASHIHTDDLYKVLAAYQKQTLIAEHFDLTFRMVANDGSVVWVQNLVSVVRDAGKSPKLRGFMIDITERKRAEVALKDLGGRLIAAQEEERRRIARELHDDFNQRLAVLSIEIEQLGQKIQKPLSLRRNVARLQKQAQEISAEIHRLSYKLHPSKLDHLGLMASVKSLCNEISESGKLTVRFQQTGFPADLPKETTLCLFRIVQECLRNCVKHSQAEAVHVKLARTKDEVRLSVSDNGVGFETKSEVMERGLGFISMKERLHILGGEIEVHSKLQRGTRIEVRIAVTPEANADASN